MSVITVSMFLKFVYYLVIGAPAMAIFVYSIVRFSKPTITTATATSTSTIITITPITTPTLNANSFLKYPRIAFYIGIASL